MGDSETAADKARKELSKPQQTQSQLRCVSDLCIADKNGFVMYRLKCQTHVKHCLNAIGMHFGDMQCY